MASRNSANRVAGTDGNDFSYRQVIKGKYYEKALSKKGLGLWTNVLLVYCMLAFGAVVADVFLGVHVFPVAFGFSRGLPRQHTLIVASGCLMTAALKFIAVTGRSTSKVVLSVHALLSFCLFLLLSFIVISDVGKIVADGSLGKPMAVAFAAVHALGTVAVLLSSFYSGKLYLLASVAANKDK
jgi:hypothetical protein